MENHAIVPPSSLTLSIALQQGPSCQVKFSEQNHKVLAAARISALDTGEKERPVMW